MKKQIALLLTIGVIVTASSCGVRPESQRKEKNSMLSVAATSTEENHLAVLETPAISTPTPTTETETLATVTPVSVPAKSTEPAVPSQTPTATPEPVPTSAAPITSAPTSEPVTTQAPEPTPVPTPEHIHDWVPVTETFHHEAVVEEVKVVDVPATEGHFEGGSYPVMVCRCGAEFTSGDAWEAHAIEMGYGHGGFTDSWRSDQIWMEGTPEVFHYETVTVQDAWDEEVIIEYRCSCGAVR